MGLPGCATCHENHAVHVASDEMLGLGARAVRASCRSAANKGGKSAAEMRALIGSLRNESDKARAILLRAEQAGLEVSQGQFDLNDAKNAVVKARTAVHTVTVDGVTKGI